MKFLGRWTLGILVFAMAAGCGDGDGEGGNENDATLTLSFTDLPLLGDGYEYEGWLITSEGPVSTGRFTVDEEGELSEDTFSIETAVSDDSSAFVLTIEPMVGDDPAPSDTHVLAGDLSGGSAALTIDHPAALTDDFTSATGDYILAAPTGGEGADFRYGIWWLIPGDPQTAGLVLPTLPAGWAYEGWVVDEDGPISTGRFTDVNAPDSDGAGPGAGDEAAPNYPGQDFLDPIRDLSVGHTAVISVEPEPDDSDAPFILKPLVHAIESVMPPETQTMDNNASATSPTGMAVIE